MSSRHVVPEPAGTTPAPIGDGAPAGHRSFWWTKRALGLHVTLVLVVPTFLALFWWQIQRVREGNTLSWAYVFEWPFFTGYAVYLWWKLVHDQLEGAGPLRSSTTAGVDAPSAFRLENGARAGEAPARAGGAELGSEGEPDEQDEQDEELAAYNRYLAELHASGRRKHW